MTKDKNFKDIVRARAAETGERYTAAREHLLGDSDVDAGLGRIVGLESRYTAEMVGGSPMNADETARYMFRRAFSWGRNPNAYVESGAHLHLAGVGVIEFSTPECAGAREVTVHARAGEMRLLEIASLAERRLSEEGQQGRLQVSVDRSPDGACFESYSAPRALAADGVARLLVPFLVSRPLLSGSGGYVDTDEGRRFAVSPRAHAVAAARGAVEGWRRVVNLDAATHADEARFRRVHVEIGDVNASQTVTLLKVGATALVLRLLEQPSLSFGTSLALADPLAALHAVSLDANGTAILRLDSGERMTAIAVQRSVLQLVRNHVEQEGQTTEESRIISQWQRAVDNASTNPRSSFESAEWAARLRHIEGSVGDIADPRAADIDRGLDTIDGKPWVPNHQVCDASEVAVAAQTPPPSTRARLRGAFIAACTQHKRDYTVDWTHLKLHDASQATIIMNDPYMSVDPRVDKMLARVAGTDT